MPIAQATELSVVKQAAVAAAKAVVAAVLIKVTAVTAAVVE